LVGDLYSTRNDELHYAFNNTELERAQLHDCVELVCMYFSHYCFSVSNIL
jgi:hypothetical protein